MKRGDKVKVIASNPKAAQDRIESLIGREFEVISYDKDAKAVSVDATETDWNGPITLNPGEYQEL